MERITKLLEINKTINDAIPSLIEVFTSFYGEECRELITEKFNNMLLVGYYDVNTLSSFIIDMQKEATAKHVKEVFDKLQIEYNSENVAKYTNNNRFDNISLFPIINIYDYISMVKKGEKELVYEEQVRRYNIFKESIPELTLDAFLNKQISDEQIKRLPPYIRRNVDSWLNEYENVSERLKNKKKEIINNIIALYPEANIDNIDELILAGKLDNIYAIGEEFKKARVKYTEYSKENIDKYVSVENRLKDLKSKIEHKYFVEYLLELKEYLNKEDQDRLDKLVANDYFYSFELKDIKIISGSDLNVGQNFNSNNSIKYFDSQSEQELNNPNARTYRKATIKENRIKYFKYRGIDLGDNYEDYVNNPECQAIWPSEEMISRIEERYNYYRDKANAEFYDGLDICKEVEEKAANIGLLDKSALLDSNMFLRKLTCVSTDIRKSQDGYQLYPIVYIYAKNYEYDDKALIHELNHLFELSLTKVKENDYEAVCGWDYLEGEIKKDNTDAPNHTHEKRKYEALNEIINELLARKITKQMHDSGIFVINSPDKYRDYGGTTYDFSEFLVEEFFDKYLTDIIASRRNNNIEIIWQKVGKENFDELNQLFHEFTSTFPEFTFYRLADDLSNKRDTDLVRKYNSIKERRDIVLAKMNDYSKNSGMTL